MENFNQEKFKRAKKRVEEIKGFYVHLSIYIVINSFILVNIYLRRDHFWEWSHFITLFAWGIGLTLHAAKTFGINPFLGKDWEERQIRKFMDKDKKDMDKYK